MAIAGKNYMYLDINTHQNPKLYLITYNPTQSLIFPINTYNENTC